MSTSTKAPPEAAVTFLVIGAHYWGQAPTVVEAKSNFRKYGGRLTDGYTVFEFPPEVEFIGVDDMGYIRWRNRDGSPNPPEPKRTEHPPRKR